MERLSPPKPPTRVERQEECDHEELWLARDRVWRCVVCQPFWFPGEVIGRSTVEEQMSTPVGTYSRAA